MTFGMSSLINNTRLFSKIPEKSLFSADFFSAFLETMLMAEGLLTSMALTVQKCGLPRELIFLM